MVSKMLLQLPPKVTILWFLNPAELVSVIQVDAYFQRISRSSNTALSPSPGRGLLLNSPEQRWAKGQFRLAPPDRHKYTTLWAVSICSVMRAAARCTTASCRPRRATSADWSHIDVDCTYIDVGLNVYEHGLIAVVTTKPHLTKCQRHVLEVLAPPLLDWQATLLRIVSIHLALVTTDFLNPLQPRDRFDVFEWQTGSLRMEVHAPNHTYASIVFLFPTLLLLPNTRTAALDVWAIPAGADKPMHPLVTLALPSLAPDRTAPNPTTTASPRAPAFATTPKEALILLTAPAGDICAPGDVLRVVRRALEQAGFRVVDEMGGALVVGSPAMDVDVEGEGEGGEAGEGKDVVGLHRVEGAEADKGAEGEGEEILDDAILQDEADQGPNANRNDSITPASLPAPLRPPHQEPWARS
ncbi:hypothetical protein D9615_007036 [Tricholomella constricta]|uniref:Uncharacterized protein n=1 Tax=Tricholomella constricta TaxID=117010 RepID=A0A8H5H898_9AGAR|nr:hypothetical protein D9615_007036 [Tricholomella constricta]